MFGYLYDGTQDTPPRQDSNQVPVDAIDVSSQQTISGGSPVIIPPTPEIWGFLVDATQEVLPRSLFQNPLDNIEVYNSITISGGSAATFTISDSPTSLTIVQGNSNTTTVTTAILNSFNASIALTATGQPSGVTVGFSPSTISAPGNGTSTATVTVGGSVTVGTYTITITGTGGGVVKSVPLTLTVLASGGSTGTGVFITQIPVETSIAPTDAKLRITQIPVETSIQPYDATVRITQIAIETSVQVTIVYQLTAFDAETDQIPYQSWNQGIQQDTAFDIVPVVVNPTPATDTILMNYKGYSISPAMRALQNDDPVLVTRRQPRVWIIIS